MKPLIVLIVASLIALVIFRLLHGHFDFQLSAKVGMSVMLLFTAMGHYMFPQGMALMIPDFIPLKKELVYFTGIIEVAAAIGLHITQFRLLTAWLLILFFILILPANIKAAVDHLDYQKATYNGPGLAYLWFRVPLQMLFIAWVYLSAIKSFLVG
ncbi:hypothetical protein LVD15_21105 [Fulvivirga maritima]|uniref:DoxX family protein n=1 Tax=Fulvivirga maritima TaxID=2904247 RepID=UPI001F2B243F|nr:hypothetical protein [Fulvivirga maritima]UII25776.1 hypothetical protein LVD15_21105 [Fulvivirga maritima]